MNAEHLKRKTAPDGHVVLTTSDGAEHSYYFREDGASWEQQSYGIVFKTKSNRMVFPWTNILHYDVTYNSADYNQLMFQWIKECDHEWLTHPSVGNYCKFCRLDMADLEKILTDRFSEVPALVIEDPAIDREAAEHEGTSGAPNEKHNPAPVAKPNVRILAMAVDPMKYCDCADDDTPHDGPCRMRPETWPEDDIIEGGLPPDDPSLGF